MLYSIFTDNISANIDLIDKIKDFLQQQHPIMDFTIFTDETQYGFVNHPTLNTFYMIAYTGSIIFLTLDDYLTHKDTISQNTILYLTKDDINSIDKNIIKNCSILTETNNGLEWIKNYEL